MNLQSPSDNDRFCTRCKNAKPLSEFHKCSKVKIGVRSKCKDCEKVILRNWRKLNEDKFKASSKEYRINNTEKIKNYRECNKDRNRKTQEAWRIENKERKRKTHLAWLKANKEKKREYIKKWIKENAEKHRGSNRRWRIANSGKVSFNKAKRRAAKMDATPLWLTAIQKAQIQEFYEIAAARSMQTGVSYQVDHIHPLQGENFRGLHVPWNLQIITASENSAKCNKMIEGES